MSTQEPGVDSSAAGYWWSGPGDGSDSIIEVSEPGRAGDALDDSGLR